MNIYEKLSNIQNELKAPKGQYNKFGGYKYRSCEDILEAVKPICKKYKTVLVLSDEIVVLGEGNSKIIIEEDTGNETKTRTSEYGQRFYVKATATLIDIEVGKASTLTQDGNGITSYVEESLISNTAYAREEENKKGMDGSQITGTASSYARKYALNGLFNIDDTKDADTDEFAKQQGEEIPKITSSEVKILEATQSKYKLTDEQVKEILNKFGYKDFKDVLKSDYAKIGNELSKGV